MDGVLIDSMGLHTEIWERYLAGLGVRMEGLSQRMLGRRNDEIMRDFFGDAMSAEEGAAHGAAKERLFREVIGPMVDEKLVAGIRRFLERVDGTPCGLASNAEPANVDFTLDQAGLRKFFHAIVDGHQVEHPKPAPDVYLMAASILGVQPANAIIFEDSSGGIEAAKAAGGRVVCVETALRNPEGVELSIQNFDDPRLEPWLLAQRPA
jgi:beta-phosphoglucomutase